MGLKKQIDELKNYPKNLEEIKNDISTIDNQLNYYRNKPKPEALIKIEDKISDFEKQKQKFLNEIGETNKKIQQQKDYSNELKTKFLDLKEGDVLKLDTEINDNLSVCINNQKKFLARPGTFKKNIAVKIVDKFDEKNMI